MTCCTPCKKYNQPQVKILKTGSSLEVQKVVRDVALAGSSLRVTNTDGTSYDLEIPKAKPANVNEVNDTTALMQASGGTPDADIINQYIAQNLEIVEQVSNFHDGWGNWVDSPFGIRISGQQYMIDRVGRIKGTNWLVFGSSAMT